MVENKFKIKVQNSSDLLPPHKAAIVYWSGRVELEYEETYSRLKSRVSRAYKSAITAMSTQPKTE
jgi:hypothetical protein